MNDPRKLTKDIKQIENRILLRQSLQGEVNLVVKTGKSRAQILGQDRYSAKFYSN